MLLSAENEGREFQKYFGAGSSGGRFAPVFSRVPFVGGEIDDPVQFLQSNLDASLEFKPLPAANPAEGLLRFIISPLDCIFLGFT